MQVYAGANHITTQARWSARIADSVGVERPERGSRPCLSPDQEELIAYYRTMRSFTSLPVIHYNNRPKTNVHIEPRTLATLAQSPTRGRQDSRGHDQYRGITSASPVICPASTCSWAGITLILRGLCYGAAGPSPLARTSRRPAVSIYDAFGAGDHSARCSAFQLAQLRIASNMARFPVVIKRRCVLIGYEAGDCVPPIAPADLKNGQSFCRFLKDIACSRTPIRKRDHRMEISNDGQQPRPCSSTTR
jgi:4-hydroxy-tetrahydrodipicolinate synthase